MIVQGRVRCPVCKGAWWVGDNFDPGCPRGCGPIEYEEINPHDLARPIIKPLPPQPPKRSWWSRIWS